MPSFVSHLESAIDPGVILAHRQVQTTHESRPLLVRYDLKAVRASVSPREWRVRSNSMWRYRELLPYENDQAPISLGETITPLFHTVRLGQRIGGLRNLFIKDESHLPTGSFKARGLAMAVTRAKELGISRLAIPTAGNAGGALAAYAARAGLDAFIFMPADTPIINQHEAALYGAKTFLVDGLIGDCGKIVRDGVERMNWFDC
jgi:threonine synthase